jgi:hypothetical protein
MWMANSHEVDRKLVRGFWGDGKRLKMGTEGGFARAV